LNIAYPPELPVSAKREEIARALREHQVVIVSGETGSGKTTQLPKILLELGYGGGTSQADIAANSTAAGTSQASVTADPADAAPSSNVAAGAITVNTERTSSRLAPQPSRQPQGVSAADAAVHRSDTASGGPTSGHPHAVKGPATKRLPMIAHTQPRRIAARSVAERIAQELGTTLGQVVGYQVRFTDHSGPDTRLKVMTDGVLLAQIQRDPELRAYDAIIVDEAHERSLNIDFLLGYLTNLLPRRPDLKVVITSATIDSDLFARHFGPRPAAPDRPLTPAASSPASDVTISATSPASLTPNGSSTKSATKAPVKSTIASVPEPPTPGQVPTPISAPTPTATPPGSPAVPSTAPAASAPVIHVTGRTYPVEIRYRPPGQAGIPEDQPAAIVAAARELLHEGDGDILVFCSGEREIRDAADALTAIPALEVLPLFSRLSAAEQHRIFERHSRRRIVLATNVAETSLTVPGIHYVIDPGTARISRYSKATKVQRLPIEPISQASANQRAGRCGRIAKGVCIRLYTEEDFETRPQFTDPEIRRTSLAAVILQMIAVGVAHSPADVTRFPFVQPPDPSGVNDGVKLLQELGALESLEAGRTRLTEVGRALARIPLDPRLARMLVEAERLGVAREVTVIAAALSIQDPRERPLEFRAQADQLHARFNDPTSDFLSLLNLWEYLRAARQDTSSSAFRRLVRSEYLNYLRIREWQDLVKELKRALRSALRSALGSASGPMPPGDSANTRSGRQGRGRQPTVERGAGRGNGTNHNRGGGPERSAAGNSGGAKRDAAGHGGVLGLAASGGTEPGGAGGGTEPSTAGNSGGIARDKGKASAVLAEMVGRKTAVRAGGDRAASDNQASNQLAASGKVRAGGDRAALGKVRAGSKAAASGAKTEPSTEPTAGPTGQSEWPAELIHRALLTGLLSQIGLLEATKVGRSGHQPARPERRSTEAQRGTYLGARGVKFGIFPGSVLKRKSPTWVMAAELVETTRMWARTCAGINPEWVEQAAPHLARRTYAEPRWSAKRGAAVITERVVVYGLPVVAGRVVLLAHQDPALARELFIRHALVEGEWATHHPFYRRNRELLERAEQLAARSRTTGQTIWDQDLFDFYDARIPRSVVSARHFDAWWKQASRKDPDQLSFSTEILQDGALEQATADFPDQWRQGEFTLDLTYEYVFGAEQDGVTVHLPVSYANQIRAPGFDWQVPGLRQDLIAALIKTLPKPLRAELLPAKDTARQAVIALGPPEDWLGSDGAVMPLVRALSQVFYQLRGVQVPAEAWNWEGVPDHLRITFRVEAPNGRVLASGHDLRQVLEQATPEVGAAIARVVESSRRNRRGGGGEGVRGSVLGGPDAVGWDSAGGGAEVVGGVGVGAGGPAARAVADEARRTWEVPPGVTWMAEVVLVQVLGVVVPGELPVERTGGNRKRSQVIG
jgi:ATP-dependent helicase HrpA